MKLSVGVLSTPLKTKQPYETGLNVAGRREVAYSLTVGPT